MALVFAILQLSTVAAELLVSFAFVPKYNWIKNTISELGVGHCTTQFDPRKGVEACSSLAGVMNSAMVFSGLCLVILTVILWRSRGFSGLPGFLWIFAGLGSIATGYITLDTSPVLHQIVSIPLFFGGPLAIALGAFQFRGGIRLFGAILGVSTLVLGVVFSTTELVFGYGGVVERLVIWPSLGWVVWVSILARKEAQEEATLRAGAEQTTEKQPISDDFRK